MDRKLAPSTFALISCSYTLIVLFHLILLTFQHIILRELLMLQSQFIGFLFINKSAITPQTQIQKEGANYCKRNCSRTNGSNKVISIPKYFFHGDLCSYGSCVGAGIFPGVLTVKPLDAILDQGCFIALAFEDLNSWRFTFEEKTQFKVNGYVSYFPIIVR